MEKWPSVSQVQILITIPPLIYLIESLTKSWLQSETKWTSTDGIVSIKDVLKYLVTIDLKEKVIFQSDSSLNLAIIFENEKSDTEFITNFISNCSNETGYRIGQILKANAKHDAKKAKLNKYDVTNITIEKLIESLPEKEQASSLELVKSNPIEYNVEISLEHEHLYVAGRYLKFSRQLPQTPWIMNGVRHFSDTSVEEIIAAPFEKIFQNSKSILSSSGREDVDVRTLGNGRPFILEIQKPKQIPNNELLLSAQKILNESSDKMVEIKDVCEVSKEATKTLLDGETSKTKSYRAYCMAQEEVSDSALEKLTLNEQPINQKTPIRVLHRRNNDTRIRVIHKCKGERWVGKDNKWFYIDLETQAGTYIKEFVHGDFGRTEPSVRDLLDIEVDIVGLDVMEVKMNWPPEERIIRN